MTIYSMTGFARVQVRVNDQLSYTLSLKSVNHRFLDVQLRLPAGLDAVEMELRKALKEKLVRGHVDLTLAVDRSSQQTAGYSRELVSGYLAAFDAARREFGLVGEANLNEILRLPGALQGESREMGTVLAGIALSVRTHRQPLPPPALLLSGGETTVTIRGGKAGRGGRNSEFLLGLGVALAGAPGIWAAAGDTDGIDGTEDAAGALLAPDSLARARAAGLDPLAVLAGHDSYSLFDALGDLIRTGPTLTNVNDIRAILVG